MRHKKKMKFAWLGAEIWEFYSRKYLRQDITLVKLSLSGSVLPRICTFSDSDTVKCTVIVYKCMSWCVNSISRNWQLWKPTFLSELLLRLTLFSPQLASCVGRTNAVFIFEYVGIFQQFKRTLILASSTFTPHSRCFPYPHRQLLIKAERLHVKSHSLHSPCVIELCMFCDSELWAMTEIPSPPPHQPSSFPRSIFPGTWNRIPGYPGCLWNRLTTRPFGGIFFAFFALSHYVPRDCFGLH